MFVQSNEKDFLLDQIQEISQYLRQYPNEDPNGLVLQWIEKHAATYRNLWQNKHQF